MFSLNTLVQEKCYIKGTWQYREAATVRRVSINGVSATKVLWVEDDQNAIVKVPIRSLVTCDLDFLVSRRVTYALLQDEGG